MDNNQDHDDDIIFEDFARLRLKGGETDAWEHACSLRARRPIAGPGQFKPVRTDVYISCD